MAKPRAKPKNGPAWRAAEAYGFDMSLIEANLRRTPAERLRAHARALALATELRQAMEKRLNHAARSRRAGKDRRG